MDVKKTLKSLPPTLDETYSRILLSLSAGSADLVAKMLVCITFAWRPLNITELAEAVIFEPGCSEIDEDARFFDPMEIIELCGSLITLTGGNDTLPSVNLSHYSVKEYLLSDRTTTRDLTRFNWRMRDAHNYIVSACITYWSLDFFRVKNSPVKPLDIREQPQFEAQISNGERGLWNSIHCSCLPGIGGHSIYRS